MRKNDELQADPARPANPSLSLKIRVDGTIVRRWRVAEAEVLQLVVDGSAELVELLAEDDLGDFTLASMLIPFDDSSGHQLPVTARVELSAIARVLSLTLTPARRFAAAGAESGSELELSCRVAAAPSDADVG